MDFLRAFNTANIREWDLWIAEKTPSLESLGATRNVLVTCGLISHQEAVDNIKRVQSLKA